MSPAAMRIVLPPKNQLFRAMPAKSSPEKDDGNGLLAATRFNAELIMIIKSYRHIALFSIFLLRLNQAYVTMIGLMAA
jgi:hypothetical protein